VASGGGLKVPKKSRKKRHLGHGVNGCARLRPEHADHVWAWDFIYDRTENGRTLKRLSVLDEYKSECLALVMARSIHADDVIEELTESFQVRGVQMHLQSDNPPEFIAKALREWLERTRAKTAY
jgi:transposase InsO family protein